MVREEEKDDFDFLSILSLANQSKNELTGVKTLQPKFYSHTFKIILIRAQLGDFIVLQHKLERLQIKCYFLHIGPC